ncbi:MAG: DUF5597 domain-containing protein [Acidobacteriia bacterium]|nr:DUF5597 domain-containing protein [Terriglobia bacterium]
MKHILALLWFGSTLALAQTPPVSATATPSGAKPPVAAPTPAIRKNGATMQMMVDGRPFLMLAGELHNSSASSSEYMKPVWKKLEAMNLNTVIGTVSWELLEPLEGKFDFTLVDDQIRQARAHNMRLVLIWFATWKNAVASYIPLWVKTDLKRFPRVQSKDGVGQEELTPLGEESLRADAKAYRALMRHIRAADPQHTVIMMQVQNETGKLHDSRDRSSLAEAAWNRPVPAELMNSLAENKAKLAPELTKIWSANGFKTSGTWPEIFGAGPAADEVFMAWYIARYVGKVTEAGKAELPIPMYANAWLVQNENQAPGAYPSGGPNPQVHDIWRAAAPQLDLLAPDIHLPDFKGVCAKFTRNGNPLFIPEARASVPNLFWAIGRHAALGYSPFGIESLPEDTPLGPAYKTLAGMIPVIAKYQAEGKVTAVVQDQADQRTQEISFGGYKFSFAFSAGGRGLPQAQAQAAQAAGGRGMPQENRGFALIVNTAPDDFVIAGQGFSLTFAPDTAGPKVAGIGTIDEGRYEKGVWIPGRRINGDENGGGTRMQMRGQGVGIQKVKLYRYD